MFVNSRPNLWIPFGLCVLVATGYVMFASRESGIVFPVDKLYATNSSIAAAHKQFLHITDVHYDIYYDASSPAVKFCHQKADFTNETADQTVLSLSSSKKNFGRHDCDSPQILVKQLIESAKYHSKGAEFIVWTGDTARHDTDERYIKSLDEIRVEHEYVFGLLSDSFNVPIIPNIGNNDVLPSNMFNLQEDSTKETLKVLASVWEPLFLKYQFTSFPGNSFRTGAVNFKQLTKSPMETFTSGGYFAARISEKLSVISLNTLLFYKKNPGVISCKKADSPGSAQLQWLKEYLSELKSYTKLYGISQQVILSGHISPASRFYKRSCKDQLLELIEEHKDVILSFVAGHSNVDYTVPIYNTAGNALIPMISASSMVPEMNPSFRVFDYEEGSDSVKLLGYTQFFDDLHDLNERGFVDMKVQYSTSKDYNMKDLSVESITSFVQRWLREQEEDELFISMLKNAFVMRRHFTKLLDKFYKQKKPEVLEDEFYQRVAQLICTDLPDHQSVQCFKRFRVEPEGVQRAQAF